MARRVRAWGVEVAALIGQAQAVARGGQAGQATRCLVEALAQARRQQSPSFEMEVLYAIGQNAPAGEIQRRLGCARNPLFQWAL
jgi:hypothetical protein